MNSKTFRFGNFEWNIDKAKQNLIKHGVDFFEATSAFLDSERVIAVDEAHSETEPRYFCIGKVSEKVLTVRFTYREGLVRIIGAGHWRKGARYMAKKSRNQRKSDEPIGNLRKIADFLPPPNELFPVEETLKITLTIDSETVDFFKKVAKNSGTKYQRMMREVLKGYAKKYA